MSYGGKIVYVKHLSHREQLDLEDLQEKFTNEAKAKGLPNEKERAVYLSQQGLWTAKDEAKLVQQESYLARLTENKKNIALPSVLNRLNEDLKKEKEKLLELKSRRYELIGFTCESYANKITNEYYISCSLFSDREMTKPLFSESEFQEVSDEDLDDIITAYNASVDPCSETNIKKLSIQDFYQSYYYLCNDDFVAFFGKSIHTFSYFQVKLANFSRYYKSLLEGVNIKSLPAKCLEDPDYLSEYLDTTKKGRELIDKTQGQAVSIVGATKEDIKHLTDSNVGSSTVKLSDKPMNMSEIMNLVKGKS